MTSLVSVMLRRWEKVDTMRNRGLENTIYFSQNSPEKQNQYDICIRRMKFIIGDWLMRLWRLKVPRSTVSKLEPKESSWYNSSPSLRIRRTNSTSSSWKDGKVNSKRISRSVSCVKTWKNQYSSSKKSHRKTYLTLRRTSVFVLCRPSTDWMRSTHIREEVFFTQPSGLNVNFIQHTFEGTPKISSAQISGSPMAQSIWHMMSHWAPLCT
jgi:aromatic ring-cleaving dioxygenase